MGRTLSTSSISSSLSLGLVGGVPEALENLEGCLAFGRTNDVRVQASRDRFETV